MLNLMTPTFITVDVIQFIVCILNVVMDEYGVTSPYDSIPDDSTRNVCRSIDIIVVVSSTELARFMCIFIQTVFISISIILPLAIVLHINAYLKCFLANAH